MFKSSRWRSDKNKFKVVFKLQFRAAQVPIAGDEALMISVVPADTGKPTSKSDKAKVREGSCFWENPLYETVKFIREPKSGKVNQKIYHFVVGNGSTSKAGVVGEASIDFSTYADATKVTLVSLPLKNSKVQAMLHVSIQRIQESSDHSRVIDENENVTLNNKDHCLRSQISNDEIEETTEPDSVDAVSFNQTVSHVAELNRMRRGSSGSDFTLSSSDSASGNEAMWQRNGNIINNGPRSDTQTTIYEEHERSSSNWGWLGDSTLEASTDDSSTEAYLKRNLGESSVIAVEKLKSDFAVLSRQAELSEVELLTLRKQIVKESRRGQDLYREVVCLKEERDALKSECEKLRAVSNKGSGEDVKTRNNVPFEAKDCFATVEELREELNHEKETNKNLRIQLQKTQQSNSELILAVNDLDEMLKKKSSEMSNHTGQIDEDNDEDEEQKALEELVKEHTEAREAYVLEREIMDLRSEIEMYKRDKDELEIQMEQLALDYEIMKQENHNMAYKLEQSQIQEQLKMQYECSSSYATARELEVQIENLENEIKIRSKESAESSARIIELELQVKGFKDEVKLRSKESAGALARVSELEAQIKKLEEELEKQSGDFEADLESLTKSTIEQEQRAIKAEETLRQTRRQSANTAEKLQGELKRLSVQMLSTFEANEKLASKALSEANELRVQKNHFEETIRMASKENELLKGRYGARLNHVSGKVRSMMNQIEKLRLEVKNREMEIETQKRHAEETERLLSNEISSLRREIDSHVCTKDSLTKEGSIHELEQMRVSIEEMESALKRGNGERLELEKEVILAKNESDESNNELNEMKRLWEDREIMVGNLRTELKSLQTEYTELKHSMSEDELAKEELRKQVHEFKSDLQKKEDTINDLEKKIKDNSIQGTDNDPVKASLKASKAHAHGSKEVTNLTKRIMLLEDQIKLKESALETSTNTFLDMEKDPGNKIEEFEERLTLLNNSATLAGNKMEKATEEARNDHENNTCDALPIARDDLSEPSKDSTDYMPNLDELRQEMSLLQKRNKSMEDELKEMQGRYSEISLRFAEVEGERQRLVMKLRNLKNAK